MSLHSPLSRRRFLGVASAGAALLAGCQTTAPLISAPASPVVSSQPVVPLRPPKIGLALGGGAARGFAHIGVIQVLEAHGIRPDLVVGTSAGSLVATLYASGKNGAELATLAKTMDESAITDWAFPGRGLLKGEALANYVRQQTHNALIEQMKIPLGVVATDLASGEPVLFRRGDAGMAVRASSAVPAVFQPVRIGNREYVDGGLNSPVPVHFARQMGAELVIAVDISSPPDPKVGGDMLSVLLQTFSIMSRSINNWELKEADIVIQPPLVGVSSADFTARMRAVESGHQAAEAQMAALKQRITQLSR